VVAIERRGVCFTLRSEKHPRRKKAKPRLEVVDRALLDGEWTWASGTRGLVLRRKPAR
jgi:hypothetical protein